MPECLLNLPVLSKPTRDSINTHPKGVDKWMADLPKADPSKLARRVFDALQELNRLDFSNKERLYILETLRTPVDDIIHGFKRNFVNDTVPLSPKNQALAEISISIYIEMAIGYKIIIAQNWTQKINILNKKHTTELIYWGIHYLSEILLTTYQLYIEHPADTWVDLHQFYLYAESHQLENTKIKDAKLKDRVPESTIEVRYKQIVLLGLVSPFRLRQLVIQRVYNALEKWCEYTKIMPAEEYSTTNQTVLIRLNSDTAPGFYLNDKAYNRIYTRVLNTAPLVHLLSEQILHQAAAEDDIALIDIPVETMKLLLVTWDGHSKRAFARSRSDTHLNMSIGIPATHLLISTLSQDQYAEPDETVVTTDKQAANKPPLQLADTLNLSAMNNSPSVPLELALDDIDEDNHMSFDNTKVTFDAPDVWDPTYTSKSVGYDTNIREWLDRKKQVNDTSPIKKQQYEVENINESASGYCVMTNIRINHAAPNIHIGDVTGICNPLGKVKKAVAIGIIRRIKNADSNLVLGIQKLAPYANAIKISRYHPQISRRKFVRSLMLPMIKSINQPVTLLTHENYHVGDEVVIMKNRHQTLVKLTKQLEFTGMVSQYTFEIEKDLGTQHSEDESSVDTAKFESVWSLI